MHGRAGAGGRHGVAAVVMLSRSLGHGCAAIVCGQPLRTGARNCPRATITMICHGGAIGPSLRTMATRPSRERTWHQPARSRPGRSQAASGPSCGPRWCLGRAATGRALLPAGSSRAPCRRVRPGRRRLCGGFGHRRWPAALVRRRRSRRRDAGGASAGSSTWVTLQLAQRTRRGRSHTRPPPEQRSERLRAKPQRRSCPEQSGHLSSEPPRSACAWSSTKITAGSFSRTLDMVR